MAATLNKGHLIPGDDPDFRAAKRAVQDSMILGFVLDQLGTPMKPSEYWDLLQRSIADPLSPEDRPERTPGRDAQTELFVAAMLKKAGMQPCFKEPDIHCCVQDGREIAIAIKRPKNPFSVRDNLLRARSQIDDAGMPGVIALDMSVATDADYEGFNMPLKREKMNQLINRFFRERIIGRLLPTIASDIQVGETIGVIFLNQCVYFEIEAADYALHCHSGCYSRQNDVRKGRLFEKFFAELGKGLPE